MRNRRAFGIGLVAAAVGYLTLRGRVRRYEIVERSMEAALEPGDFVIARPVRDLARGTVVVFAQPGTRDFDLVKRVVGMPGESVVVHNGQVHVNGAVLAERWADGPTLPDGEWHLGPDEVFVLGDNRAVSAGDSRMLGPIPLDSIGWRVVARYWPLRTAGRIMGRA